MKQILMQSERPGSMPKWVIDLGEHDIVYKPRASIKGQAQYKFYHRYSLPHHTIMMYIYTSNYKFISYSLV